MNAWAVLLGRPPASPDFQRSCGWLQERLGGVILVAEDHAGGLPERLRHVAEPGGHRGVVGRLTAGLRAAPEDARLIVYVDSALLDPLAEEAVSEMLQVIGPDDAAVVRGAPMTDALKLVAGQRVHGSVDREGLYQLTSPMVLRREALEEARERVPDAEGLDPVSLLLAAGRGVRMLAPHQQTFPILTTRPGFILG